ncbi:MAG: amino acid ABC transporter substrate-binding protein [Crenarchaeota archaeon]|nr:amino acid ABC transporter substrate-binding protein [Thermoproteota archaeon]
MRRVIALALLSSIVLLAVSPAELELLTKPYQLGPNCESIKKVVEWSGGPDNINLPQEIPIGAPAPLSGALGSFAVSNYNAIKMAADDINGCMQQLGLPWRFKFIMEDTRTDPQVAVEVVRKLALQGVQIIAGRITSRPMGSLMYPVNSELHVVVMSATSTAPNLRIANYNQYISKTGKSYIFWAITNDYFQGDALASLAHKLGYRKVTVMYRQDDYGVGLANAFKYYFSQYGGETVLVPYDPNARTFDAELRIVANSNPDAILFISFDELKVILRQALQLGLQRYPWLFSETCRGVLLSDPQLAKIVALKNGMGTGPGGSDQFAKLYQERFGMPPMLYADYIYDTLWLSALSVLKAKTYNADAIRQALIEVGAYFRGYTGPKTFNPLTQEVMKSVYHYWTIKIVDGKPEVVKVGLWDPEQGINMFQEITPR